MKTFPRGRDRGEAGIRGRASVSSGRVYIAGAVFPSPPSPLSGAPMVSVAYGRGEDERCRESPNRQKERKSGREEERILESSEGGRKERNKIGEKSTKEREKIIPFHVFDGRPVFSPFYTRLLQYLHEPLHFTLLLMMRAPGEEFIHTKPL